MDRSATYDLLLLIHSNYMGLSRTVSEINGDFCQKSQNSLGLFNAPAEFGIGGGLQNVR